MGEEKQAVAFVNGRYFHRNDQYQESASEEVVSTHVFDGQVAKVRRGYGLTINLGNYESARFDVSLEVPCYIEDVNAADEFARLWVEERCEAEVAEVRGRNAPKKGATPLKPSEKF